MRSGLRTDRSLLVIPDGSKALREAVRTIFGEAARQVHKTRNILEYLSDRDRPWAHALLRRAYQTADPKPAQRLLLDLVRRLEAGYPSAAESVPEGLHEPRPAARAPAGPRHSVDQSVSPRPRQRPVRRSPPPARLQRTLDH